MQTFTLELYPTRGHIHISFYKNVTNAEDLRKRLLARDQELSYAFIDARVVNTINKRLNVILFCFQRKISFI